MGSRTRGYGLSLTGTVAAVLVAAGLGVGAGKALADMPVVDVTTWAELMNLLNEAKEQVKVATDTFNEVQSYVTVFGKPTDMAQGFMGKPLRLVNEVGKCLNGNTALASFDPNNLSSLCAGMGLVEQEFTPHGSGGNLPAGEGERVQRNRQGEVVAAAKQGLGLAKYELTNRSNDTDLLSAATEAGSPISSSAQANQQNRLLVELLTEQRKTNTFLAALLRIQSADTLRQTPVIFDTSSKMLGQ